jgi:hypothetical protein
MFFCKLYFFFFRSFLELTVATPLGLGGSKTSQQGHKLHLVSSSPFPGLSDLEEKPPCDACPTRATTTTASTCTLMYSVTHQTPLKLADNVNNFESEEMLELAAHRWIELPAKAETTTTTTTMTKKKRSAAAGRISRPWTDLEEQCRRRGADGGMEHI